MTYAQLSKYEVGRYDTAESISSGYGLSWKAIKNIPANEHLRYQLPDSGKVATGLLLSIPPHAGRLARERLNVLHRVRPQVLSHFHRFSERAKSELRPILEDTREPMNEVRVRDVMAELERSAASDIDALATAAMPLVGICSGMAHTHIATESDRQVAASANDPQCGLYWLVSPQKYEPWRSLWVLQTWSSRWQQSDGPSAWEALLELNNTVMSIVVQSIDEKIRIDQNIENQLLIEFRRSSSGE
jgi:hypothetical protein